eukprot:g34948.t1
MDSKHSGDGDTMEEGNHSGNSWRGGGRPTLAAELGTPGYRWCRWQRQLPVVVSLEPGLSRQRRFSVAGQAWVQNGIRYRHCWQDGPSNEEVAPEE